MAVMTYSDESLAERFDRTDERFDRTDRRIDDLRAEAKWRFDDVNRRIDDAKVETNRRIDALHGSVAELRGSAAALQTILARGSVGVIVCLIGLIGTLLAKGG